MQMTEEQKGSPTLGEVEERAARGAFRKMVPRVSVVGLVFSLVATGIITFLSGWNSVPIFGFTLLLAWILLGAISLGPLRRLEFNRIIQDEKLDDLYDQMVLGKGGPLLAAVLDGREIAADAELPAGINLSHIFHIKRQLVLKGQLRKGVRLYEFVCRKKSPNTGYSPGDQTVLGSMYVAIGRYPEGTKLLRERLDEIKSEVHPNGRLLIGLLIQLAFASIVLHRAEEARVYLEGFRKLFEEGFRKDLETVTRDLLEKIPGVKGDMTPGEVGLAIDLANFWELSGEFKALAGDPSADEDLEKAETLMSIEETQGILTLFLPSVKHSRASLALKYGDFRRAEKLAGECLEYFEKRTRYRGPDYFLAKSSHAFARMRQSPGGSASAELEAAVQGMKCEVEDSQLDLATCLVRLGESRHREGDTSSARAALQEALDVRSRQYPERDEKIQEARMLLAALG